MVHPLDTFSWSAKMYQLARHKNIPMIRTRIAPSPTGEDLHIGNLYTALLNYAVAKKNNGKFIVRIEDTDRERFREGAEAKILLSLQAYGLTYDEGPDIGGPFAPYRQSERLSIYKKYALELVEKGVAYYCICTKERLEALRKQQEKEKKRTKYDKYCLNNAKIVKTKVAQGEPYVIRLNVLPNRKVSFKDLIRGEISISSNELDDQVLIKSDGYPTYHLGVVVDDHLMEITHIIRAEEWISSTPKHVLLYEAFQWPLPIFAHGPILRNPDRSKLSKRKNPVWASWYLEHGYLPEAVLNYLALMGWSHPEQKEIFSLEEFIKVFDLKDLKPVGPAFDLKKLTWMNQQYIQRMDSLQLMKRLQDFYSERKLDENTLRKLLPLVKTRMETLKDFEALTNFLFFPPHVSVRNDTEKKVILELRALLSDMDEWTEKRLFGVLKTVLEKYHIRMPVLYYLLTGEEKGLPLPQSLEILGKEETLKRLQNIR